MSKPTVEEWRPVRGFESAYEVSNFGRLRSIDRRSCGKNYHGKMIVDFTDALDEYTILVLTFERKKRITRLHRIVAEAFLPNPLHKKEVNHINGIKGDNRVCNLEWATHRENTDHAWAHGLTPPPPKNKGREVVQLYEGKEIATYKSIKIASLINNISEEDICKCCKCNRFNAGRYSWRYKEDAQ